MPLPDALPQSFTAAQARAAGLSKNMVYLLRDRGEIEQVSRGVYRRTAEATESTADLVELAHRAPGATLCLATALARHELIDEIPARLHVALPRGRWRPTVQAHVRWHTFDPERFEIGRETISVDDAELGCYNAERSLLDMFRLRGNEDEQLAYEALRTWLGQRGNRPATLLRMAKASWPSITGSLRRTLEIMQ